MMRELGVHPHNTSTCSMTLAGDRLFVCTSNGVDETDLYIPAPEAPSFLAMNRHTGEVLWSDNSPGTNILHGQWSSPAYAVLGGQPQVIFPGGDGWLYSFDPAGDGQGRSKLLWRFDANPKDSIYGLGLGARVTRNAFVGFPVIYDGLVYIAVGDEPERGEGQGHLWCIDPTKRGDVSAEIALDKEGQPMPHRRLQAVNPNSGESTKPNPNSAAVWHYTGKDCNGDGERGYDEVFNRSISTAAIKDDILYIPDIRGILHCLDAKTGEPHWTYDMFAACWSSVLIVDGKVYVGNEEGDLTVFHHSADPKIPQDGIVKNAFPDSIYSTPIVANGVLYVATRKTLFAIAASE